MYEAEVEAGAVWLDAEVPGWEARVNDEKLKMNDGCLCILGQVFAEAASAAGESVGFEWASVRFAGSSWWNYSSMEWLCARGFLTHDESNLSSFALLQDAWLDLLADRRIARRAEEIARQAGRL
jgi:hypothetical protein